MTQLHWNRPWTLILFFCGTLWLSSGCGRQGPIEESFEPNLVQAMKYQIRDQIPMEQASVDAMW
ncbi:MAG: hypothetical protein MI861_11955, partial [Pirellulales bacterium]|nr:hypothetical protein [Pirellulales bacterium]